jgi:acetyl esterase/lipase
MGREVLFLPAPPADCRIPYGEHSSQFGDLRLPAGGGPHPVAIVIHGGFWRVARDLTYAGNPAASLTATGWATWNIEYRRVGEAGGGYPGTLEDLARASDKLRHLATAYNLNLDRVIAIGHSAGGHLALWLAAAGRGLPLRAALSLGGVPDLGRAWQLGTGDGAAGEFLGGGPDQFPERYRHASPIERLPVGIPVRLFHGERDQIVPIEIAERFHRAARAAGDDCRLYRVPGDHFDVIDIRTGVWRSVAAMAAELAGLR